MFSSEMYQQAVIQIREEQLHQHFPMKERTDNIVNNVKKDGSHNVFIHNASQQHYQHNNKFSNKQNNWPNTYSNNLRVLSSLGQSQETICPRPPSHDSHTDSSSEDSNDLVSKGVKRLHELNGIQTHFVHSFSNSGGYPQVHQSQYKRRNHMNKYNSPPHVRRNNKHVPSGGNNYDVVPDRYLARSESVQVKLTPKQLVCGSEWDQLSTAIWKKFIKNQQTSEHYVIKMNLFKQLYTNIKHHLRYSVFVVGSTFNGFGTSTSDLDLCLVIKNQHCMDPKMSAMYHLFHVYHLLNEINGKGPDNFQFQNCDLIAAKVPLLKLRHCSGVDVDINCNNCVGIRNTHLLHCYSKADWRVQPLVLVVKLWAQSHQINDAKNSTISSYSLALMVIHFLQCGVQPAVLPCLQLQFPHKFLSDGEIHDITVQETLELPPTANTQSLGQLLLQFFNYYCNFDFEKVISVRLGTTLPKEVCKNFISPKNDPRAWTYLCIEEPFDRTNTARAIYNEVKWNTIKQVFQESHRALQETHSLDSIFQPIVPT